MPLEKSDIQEEARRAALELMECYGLLIAKGNPEEIRLILQRAFLGGYGAGLKRAHAIDMEVMDRVLGGK